MIQVNPSRARRGFSMALALAGSLWCASVQALDPDLTLAQLNHKSWLTKDGAPVGILSMAQGHDGTLWVASRTGLYRFNGIKFAKYGEAGEPALQSEQLVNAAVMRDGSLWLSPLFGGLDRLHNGRVTHFPPGQDLPRGTVRSVAEDRDGVIWAAANGGVARFVGGRWERLGPEWDLPAAPTTDVVATPQGDVWIRTLGGVFQLPAGQKQFREVQRFKPIDMTSQTLAAAKDGAVWSFSSDKLLSRIAPGGAPVPVQPFDRTGQMLLDRDGQLWVGGGQGIRRFRPTVEPHDGSVRLGAPEVLAAPDALSAPYTGSLFEDREGNIWVATTGGLDRFSNTDLVRVRVPFTEDYLSLSPGADGEMYVSGQDEDSKGGIVRVVAGDVARKWPCAPVHATLRTADGANWFASVGSLSRIQGDSQQVWTLPPEIASRPPQTMVQDADGALWVSIGGLGLHRFANDSWNKVTLEGLPGATAIASGRDATGRLWFGYPTGVAVVERGAVRNFGAHEGLDIGSVTAIHAAGERLWLGGERGIVRVDGARFVRLETAQARLLSGIAGMAEDAHGGLWAATYSSVVHIAADELRRALGDPSYKVRADTYDYLDGMPGVPRQLRPTPSLVLGSDGKVWVATDIAVLHIDPRRLHAAPPPPPVALLALRSDEGAFTLQEGAPPPVVGASKLEIDYEAWSLKLPERVHFRYRLAGVDNGWQDAGTRRTAYYSHLSPGHYRFEVEASVGNGDWSATPARLSFTVPPAWYQTWWFRALCVLAVLAALWALYRWRMARVSASVAKLVLTRLEGRLGERERIARELHDTLLQSVQGLILSIQGTSMRMPGDDPLRRQIEGSLERADEVLAEARDRVRDLRTSGQEDTELTEALGAVAADVGTAHTTTCTTTCSGEPRPLDRSVRDEVYRIAREAMVNAFRHAQARHVTVEVRYDAQGLVVTICDDGRGIDAQVLERGSLAGHWGLPGMRERSERISARFEMTSSAQAGTRVCVTVPARVAYVRGA